jgi:endonuclease/exonuclease/phosphatase family metal-dependent hydrolase
MSSLLRKARLALPVAALAIALAGCVPPGRNNAAPGDYDFLFCFWNTENFFDDRLDGEKKEPDKDFDGWFAGDKEALELKLSRLTEILAKMNGGRGPDILAIAEAESERAAELLAEALNKAVRKASPYKHIAFRDPKGGRHIATAVITRLPLVPGKTQLLGRRQRMLETHINVNGHDLVVLATHWSSRVSDEGEARERYAEVIYGRFHAMYKANPEVDLLVCGDFNDNPDDKSVTEYLHATGDLAKVRPGIEPPMLFNLFAKMWEDNREKPNREKLGSHYYRGRAYIFDQIVVSPGLLDDQGWKCMVKTASIHRHEFVDRQGRPLRFGTRRDRVERGVSDHFPVTVRLQVAPGA